MTKGWLKTDPYVGIRFHKEQVERDFLDKSELKKLLDKQIDIPRLSQIRDVFAFCCLTGLAFSDVTTAAGTYCGGHKWCELDS